MAHGFVQRWKIWIAKYYQVTKMQRIMTDPVYLSPEYPYLAKSNVSSRLSNREILLLAASAAIALFISYHSWTLPN